MSLSKEAIENSIGQLLDSTNTELEQSKTSFKSGLADIIIAAIQSATLTIPGGAIVTVGSAATQQNASPVVVEGGLS